MDKWQGQQQFWESFGIPAYDEQHVFTEEDREDLPHLVYQSFGGNIGQTATLSASLWYKGASMAPIKRKATEIEQYIRERQPLCVKINGGYLWVKVPETIPFAQPAGSDNDNLLRIILTVEAESLTAF